MIVVNAIIQSNAANIASNKSAIAAMEQASQAELGCLDYTFSVELNNPEVLRITEKWETAAALKAHFTTSHMATFQASMADHPPKSVDVSFYEATEIERPQ